MPGHLAIVPARAVEDQRLGDAALRCLLALGSHTDKDGWCRVKQSTIASVLGVTRQAVQRQISALIELGYVGQKRTGRSSRYRVLLDAKQPDVASESPVMQPQVASDATSEVASDATSRGCIDRTTFPKDTSQRTTTSARPDDARAQFDEHFWPAYPPRNGRKIGKADALTQWARLSLEDRRAALRGAKAMAADVAAGLALPPDAHRWLRRRSWEDWQGPPTVPTNGHHTNGKPTTVARGLDAIRNVKQMLDERGVNQ